MESEGPGIRCGKDGTMFFRKKQRRTITAGITCRDDEVTIQRWIDLVKDHVDEMVIVDTGSVDGTLEIVEKKIEAGLPIKLHRDRWVDFCVARNNITKYASGEYVLQIDADEVVLTSFLEKLQSIIRSGHDNYKLYHFNAEFPYTTQEEFEKRARHYLKSKDFEKFSYPRSVLYKKYLPEGVCWGITKNTTINNELIPKEKLRTKKLKYPLFHAYPEGHKMLDPGFVARKIFAYHKNGHPWEPDWDPYLREHFTPEEIEGIREETFRNPEDLYYHYTWWANTHRRRD
jgi:glycosyltransferase involved in cell wall biosynthesis